MQGSHFGVQVDHTMYNKMTMFMYFHSNLARRQWTKLMSMFNIATGYMLNMRFKPSGQWSLSPCTPKWLPCTEINGTNAEMAEVKVLSAICSIQIHNVVGVALSLIHI